MYLRIAIALLMLASCGKPAAVWTYEALPGGGNKACILSKDTIVLTQTAASDATPKVRLCLTKETPRLAFVSTEFNSPLICRGETCPISLQFDDHPGEVRQARGLGEISAGFIFEDGPSMSAHIEAAKTMSLHMPDDRGKTQLAHFDLGGLDWSKAR